MKKKTAASRSAPPAGPSTAGGRWPAILLAASVALAVAAVLVTSESAVTEGGQVILTMGWTVLLVAWVGARAWQGRPLVRADAADLAILAFLALLNLSAVVMMRAGHGRSVLNAVWIWNSFGMLFFVVRDLAAVSAARRAVCAAFIALSLGLVALAVYQYLVSFPAQRARYEANPEAVLQQAGISAPEGSPARRQFEDRLRSTEPFATFALANSLAGFLVPVVVIALGLALSPASGIWRTPRGGLALSVCLCGMLICLLLTKSRTAILAVLAGALLVVGSELRGVWARHWRRWAALTAAVLLLAALLLMVLLQSGIWDRQVLTEAPKSVVYRLEFWQATAAMIADYPWLGCGPGNFQQFYTQYKLPQASETVADPHNFVLEIAATAGLPALLLFAVAAGAWARSRNRLVLPAQPSAGSRAATAAGGPSAGPVWLGLALGVPVALVAGWPTGQPPHQCLLSVPAGWAGLATFLLLCGAPLGLVAWCLEPWVREGTLPPRVLRCGLLALLINLLAAGGISSPGVGQWVWVLAAIGWAALDGSGQVDSPPGGRRFWPLTTAFAAVILLLLCYATLYRPVLGAQRHLARGDAGWLTRNPVAAWERALAVDPWWSRPAERLAQWWHQQWMAAPSPRSEAAFRQAMEEALDRNRRSSRLYRQYGDGWLRMHVKDPADRFATRAVQAYRQAVALYPNSNILRAQLAWALHVAGERSAARREAEEAVRLDRLVPHAELKLAAQKLVGVVPRPGLPRDAHAEQIVRFLRSGP